MRPPLGLDTNLHELATAAWAGQKQELLLACTFKKETGHSSGSASAHRHGALLGVQQLCTKFTRLGYYITTSVVRRASGSELEFVYSGGQPMAPNQSSSPWRASTGSKSEPVATLLLDLDVTLARGRLDATGIDPFTPSRACATRA